MNRYTIKKIYDMWIAGWIILFKYMVFGLLAGCILVPLYLIREPFGQSLKIQELLFLIPLSIIYIPFAFILTSKICGIITDEPKKKSEVQFYDPETGIVTVIDEKSDN
jgi:hypothetical protein